MRDAVEDVFLDWQSKLEKPSQCLIRYEDFDSSLQTVYVIREGDFDTRHLTALERLLQEEVGREILVSSLRIE